MPNSPATDALPPYSPRKQRADSFASSFDKLDLEKVDARSVTRSVDEAPPEERRLVRKLDSRIMPLACILYLFACESWRR